MTNTKPKLNVTFCGRLAAEKMQPDKNTVMISITDPGLDDADLKEGWRDVLRLKFFDTTQTINKPYFTNEMAREILDFIDTHYKSNVVVHCEMGISRSAAVALVLKHFGYNLTNKVEDANLANARVIGCLAWESHIPIPLPQEQPKTKLYW